MLLILQAPVITLVGDTQITVEVGTTYTDLGATASDNYDGDITADISVTNPVDTSVIGSYTVTYNVTDDAVVMLLQRLQELLMLLILRHQ